MVRDGAVKTLDAVAPRDEEFSALSDANLP